MLTDIKWKGGVIKEKECIMCNNFYEGVRLNDFYALEDVRLN